MRTIMLFLLAAVALIGCEDVQTNSPALQASLNDEFYKSTDVRAQLSPDGSLVIQGMTDLEKLTITLSGSSEGVYTLGGNGTNRAVFEDFLGSIYTTRPFGNGEVVIENSADNTFSGTFKFNAYRFGLDTLNAQQGHFYKVPILDAPIDDDDDQPMELNALVDDNNFNPSIITAVTEGNTIVIRGANQNDAITLQVPSDINTGNYPVDNEAITATYTLDGAQLATESGEITISAHDTEFNLIAGTFSFQTGDPENIQITEGTFSVNY
ncbi:hypothetical protein GCM10011312_12940 [Planktosalinus lacus]|uniref:Lipoprotein n=2 Tax=Planktosalinus lacus TaxID=1526573 RepID=A0A8J2Y9S8_9FLAO|nr:hypothetical protein GCM10011312_12940 [Planktosalinus lacus]